MLVFLGGFAIMVLEIIGARYLAKDFGSSFYVWVSQIGVILIALALGYVELTSHSGATASAIDGEPEFLNVQRLFKKIHRPVLKKIQS